MELLYIFGCLCTLFPLTIACFALYITYRRKQFAHIPGPPILNFFNGHMNEFRRILETGHPSDHLLLEWHKMYGKVVCCWFYHVPFVSVADADLIKELLITKKLPKSVMAYSPIVSYFGQRNLGHGLVTETDNQKWSKRRKIFNSAFHRVCLKDMMSSFNSSADLFIEKLLQKANGKNEIVMAQELPLATLDVISKVAFGTDLNILSDPNCKFRESFALLLGGVEESFRDPFQWMNPFLLPYHLKVRSAIKHIRDTGKKIIEVRQLAIIHGEQVPNDILQQILAIAEEDPTADMEDMLDEFVTFFLAGHETTANTLAFCLLKLGHHDEIMQRLEQEVFEVLGDRTTVQFDDLAKMHHMGETLKETLRLYPPATGTVRSNEKEELIGGFAVPRGTSIMISSYISGRLPAYWSNAEEFDSLRFENDEAEKRPHFTYFPFSAGPRNCIGQHFAQIEAKVLLSRLLQTFKFKLVPGQTKAIAELGTLRPRDGVICTMVARKMT